MGVGGSSPLASTIAYPSEPDDRLGFFLYKSCSSEQDFFFVYRLADKAFGEVTIDVMSVL